MYRRCWKEGPKIRKLTKFNGDTSKDSQDIGPQSREMLQTFVWWKGGGGRGTNPPLFPLLSFVWSQLTWCYTDSYPLACKRVG